MKFLRRKKILIISSTLCFLFLFLFIPFYEVSAETDNIKTKIKELQEQIKELEKQQKFYEENIRLKRKEAVTLKNQISILETKINKTKTEIRKKETEIQKANLEIKEIQAQIKTKNIEISDLKERIIRFLKKIYQYDNKKDIEIVLLNERLSDYFNFVKANLDIQTGLQKTLDKTQNIKIALEDREEKLRDKKIELEKLKKELSTKKNELESDKKAKNYLLEETRGAEWKFQTLLAQARLEMREIELEITRFERELRKKLAEEEKWKKLEELGVLVFSWPVPNEGIVATFHDPDYPFKRWLGEHSGIDIRASQGTPVRASASGYVARAKYGGMGYSYLMIIHQQGFSTVYGHLSKILVEEGIFVKRGEIIGLTGGLPGTPGAGRFSTGPHLHFEIRRDGIPVNPLNYLP